MVRVIILRLTEAYFRHRWLYLLPILITVGASVIYLNTIEHQYDSKSVMFVQNDSYLASLTSVRNPPYSYATPAQLTSGELRELLQTESFLRAIVSGTDLEKEMSGDRETINETLTEVSESIWIQILGNNQIVIHAVHSDPSSAFELSAATTEAYIQWKINLDRIESGAAEVFFANIISNYEVEVELARDNLLQFLETHPTPGLSNRPEPEMMELDQLQTVLATAIGRYEQTLASVEAAQLATAQAESDIRNSYFVIDAPRVPENATTSLRQIAKNAGIFLAAGVILSVAAVTGAALLDRSLRFPIDVRHNLSLPVLTIIPDVTPKRRWFWQRKRAEQMEESAHDKEKQAEEQDKLSPVTVIADSNMEESALDSVQDEETHTQQAEEQEKSAPVAVIADSNMEESALDSVQDEETHTQQAEEQEKSAPVAVIADSNMEESALDSVQDEETHTQQAEEQEKSAPVTVIADSNNMGESALDSALDSVQDEEKWARQVEEQDESASTIVTVSSQVEEQDESASTIVTVGSQAKEQDESASTIVTAGSNGGSTMEKEQRAGQGDQSESSVDNMQEPEDKVTIKRTPTGQ